jgi:hypothetical protein
MIIVYYTFLYRISQAPEGLLFTVTAVQREREREREKGDGGGENRIQEKIRR